MLSWCLLVCDIRPSSQGSSASQGPALPLHASDRLPARGQPCLYMPRIVCQPGASQGPALPLHASDRLPARGQPCLYMCHPPVAILYPSVALKVVILTLAFCL